MITPQILERFGATQERLKEIFTAKAPDLQKVAPEGSQPAVGEISKEEADKIRKDVRRRLDWETKISNRLDNGIEKSLKSWRIYAAVDLAWDATITKETLPLQLFAQGRINDLGLARELTGLKCAESFVKEMEGAEGKKVTWLDLPPFYEMNINLLRSMVTRRHAAQTVKYNSLWPAYKYEARGTGEVAKLKADVVSMAIDAQTDAFGHREHEDQVGRDVLLYGWQIDLVRSAWERDSSYVIDARTDLLRETIDREGVMFVNPHPSRVFYDDAHSLSTINSDTGCTYVGYWDLIRYGDILNNGQYWNRKELTFNDSWIDMWTAAGSQGAAYQNMYFSQMSWTWPGVASSLSADRRMTQTASGNTRKSDQWLYSGGEEDAMSQIAVYYEKIIPIDYGIGTYPKPIWIRLVTAGLNGTVIHGEFLPSLPGAYWGHNQKDDRVSNMSFALSVLPIQDQLTNLFTQLLAVMAREQMLLVMLDTDLIEAPDLKEIRRVLGGKDWFSTPILIPFSGAKVMSTGLSKQPPITVSQTTSNPQSIEFIFRAIAELLRMAERLEAMSPNESGQPIVRGNGGVTATEASQIEQTTTAVYGSLSDARDTHRAAKKRIFYESWMAFGNPDFKIPVMGRYTKATVEKAGLTVLEGDEIMLGSGDRTKMTVGGSKWTLSFPYVFSSRDGSERTRQQEVAQILVSMLDMLRQNPSITWGQINSMINAIIRNSGAGEDLVIETIPEMENQPVGDPTTPQVKEIQGAIEGVIKKIEELTAMVGQQGQALQTHTEGIEQQKQSIDQQKQAMMEQMRSQTQQMQGQGDQMQQQVQAANQQVREQGKQVRQQGQDVKRAGQEVERVATAMQMGV